MCFSDISYFDFLKSFSNVECSGIFLISSQSFSVKENNISIGNTTVREELMKNKTRI